MITIQVCVGSACHLKGSYNIIDELSELAADFGAVSYTHLDVYKRQGLV